MPAVASGRELHLADLLLADEDHPRPVQRTGSGGWGTGNSLGGTCNGKDQGYTKGPYYINAYNKIRNFRRSGLWQENDCGSASGSAGKTWMRDTACESPN